MASTGVLPFVRGIDFTSNDFADGGFPKQVADMTNLRWIRLNKVNMETVPYELRDLSKLEHVSLVHNGVGILRKDLQKLSSLRVLNLRHNELRTDCISPEIFKLEDLSVVDFSYNHLDKVPDGLDTVKSLLVLNLSHNNIAQMPNQLFVNCTDILYLDLSDNKLETLPPQLRRLLNLQTLILNNNPMEQFQLRQLPSLTSLTTLHLRSTQRVNSNIPDKMGELTSLIEIDLSYNDLSRIPDGIYSLKCLKRLNLSHNNIKDLGSGIEAWSRMETLNVSWNKLKSLPSTLCKLTCMKKLYLNSNEIDFEGIPSGIGKLHQLEVFMSADNNLEMIPEGLCRCGKLKKLILNHNRLVTLPESVHLLPDLVMLDVRDNPDLIMPPKPQAMQKGSGLEFYNIDFSLNHQLRLAGAAPVQTPGTTNKPKSDPLARKMRLRRKRDTDSKEPDSDQKKILKGFHEITKKKHKKHVQKEEEESLKAKKWKDELEKPPLDYSDFFEEDVGHIPGITIWEIENFLPAPLEDEASKTFYEGDCYIVLKTYIDNQGALEWQLFYWIGSKATLDKKACSAIHAVNLRNFLGAESRTIREEQGEESDEFLEVFEGQFSCQEGARTASGFYSVEELEFPKRLYRCSGTQNIHLEPMEITPDSLDPRFVYLLDCGKTMYVWYGAKSRNITRSKTRLLAEKINKNERKNESEIIMFNPKEETFAFWRHINSPLGPPDSIKPWIKIVDPPKPILYKVGLGMGYLELPQVEIPRKGLTPDILDSKSVYILDTAVDLFIWMGKQSTRLVRAAALKLSQELFYMIKRSNVATVIRTMQGTEVQIFKAKFIGWDDVIAVDFTRSAESVARRGADIKKILADSELKCDLAALFMPRQPFMPAEEAETLMEEWNEDLEGMEAFVLEGKKFVRLPEAELGQFYSGDCYVFLCRYWIPRELEESSGKEGEEQEQEPEDDYQCVVYFWQGRGASNMGWLTFTFSLQKKFESLFGEKLEVTKMYQQQENLKFLSHFKKRFIIHQGKRKSKPEGDKPHPTLFHLRANGSQLCTRCIQVAPNAASLCSAFCYILKIPFDSSDSQGILYVWHGSRSKSDECQLAEEIAQEIFNKDKNFTVTILAEGKEPENFFWVALGGKKAYDKEADFMKFTRLFRCSNEKGYFAVSEKCTDFCQDDLADEDIMILDNGVNIFLWLGSRCSDVEVKLAFKSAQVYLQNVRAKQPEHPRKLLLTLKGKESRKFTKCFHGWGQYKKAPGPV